MRHVIVLLLEELDNQKCTWVFDRASAIVITL